MKLLSFAMLIALFFLPACRYFMPDPPCPPPPSVRCPLTETFSFTQPTVPPVVPIEEDELGLVELVDIAFLNNPQTRSAWYKARQAAADLGIARGAYLPPIDFTYTYNKILSLAVDPGSSFTAPTIQEIHGPQLSTSFLLMDFGGREGQIKQATAALYSLNWTYNWQVQSVMIQVIQNYYNYINAIGIVEADEATVNDNLTTLEAAAALTKGGVRGIADELQAKTAFIQSLLVLENDKGVLNVARANLAQSLGLPADTPLTVVGLPKRFATHRICAEASALLHAAKTNRADLMALRETVLENRAKIQVARSALYPTINTLITTGRQWVNGVGPSNVYNAIFNLNIPLFDSFADINALRQAQDAWLQAQAELDNEELQAFLVVLTDYYQFIANTEILKYSYNYINVALKNKEVAFANYRAGINTIIDLMVANNGLNSARQQLVDAKTNWLTSLANLAYDTGGLNTCSITHDFKVIPTTIPVCEYEECWDSEEESLFSSGEKQ